MTRTYNDFLFDILNECRFIIKNTERRRFSTFLKNELFFRAICRSFEIIGEASKHIPKDIKKQIINVNWSEVAAMRNIIIHNYHGLEEEVIWKTCKEDIPILYNKITSFIELNNMQMPDEK